MSLVQIDRGVKVPKHSDIFALGFRPFFLGAATFTIVNVVMWGLMYFGYMSLPLAEISIYQWHAHEMIYGFSVAVIAGFLLTAVMNWTGCQTLEGARLAALFSLWLLARVLFFFGTRFIAIVAAADLLFMLCLFLAVLVPVYKTKQWKQSGILSKLILLFVGNVLFYLGAFGLLDNGTRWSIYGGLFLVVGLILTIGSRVMPAFIRNGVDYDVEVHTSNWLVSASLALFLLFVINYLFIFNQIASGWLSIALFGLNFWRLVLWHTPGIWRKPLLWGLYLAFVFIDLGFLLFALAAFDRIPPLLPVHAFTFGGIGLATLSMMSRVTLGHTGRNIRTPAALTPYALTILTIGTVFRVLFPLIDSGRYPIWILVSQLCWIAAFAAFLISYSRMLLEGGRAA